MEKTTDQILRESAERDEQHQIVGEVIHGLNQAGFAALSSELLFKHIMTSGRPQNPQTFKDLGKEI